MDCFNLYHVITHDIASHKGLEHARIAGIISKYCLNQVRE